MYQQRLHKVSYAKPFPHITKYHVKRRVGPAHAFHAIMPTIPLDLASTALVAVGATVAYVCYKLIRLALADADLHLLGLGKHSANAFRDKVVWITGSSQGLGAILAKYFADFGARIILSSRDVTKLERVKASLGLGNDRVLIIPFDLCSDFSELEKAAAAADDAFGSAGVDYLIHNAGWNGLQGGGSNAEVIEVLKQDALV